MSLHCCKDPSSSLKSGTLTFGNGRINSMLPIASKPAVTSNIEKFIALKYSGTMGRGEFSIYQIYRRVLPLKYSGTLGKGEFSIFSADAFERVLAFHAQLQHGLQ